MQTIDAFPHILPKELFELDRAVGSLGGLGVQIFTNVNGHALDEPRFDQLFARLSALDRPI